MAIEIGEAYSEETLLAVVLWWPLQGNKFMGECETPQSVVKLANEILQISMIRQQISVVELEHF